MVNRLWQQADEPVPTSEPAGWRIPMVPWTHAPRRELWVGEPVNGLVPVGIGQQYLKRVDPMEAINMATALLESARMALSISFTPEQLAAMDRFAEYLIPYKK